ncbi:MAG: MlaE family lipid ABC transporter permease subunit [Pseudomonadota bacterium]
MVEAGGQAAAFKTGVQGDVLTLNVVGDWRAAHLGSIDDALRDYADDTTGRELIVDLSGLKRLDTTGAMMIQRTFQACDGRTHKSAIVGANAAHEALLRQVVDHLEPCEITPPQPTLTQVFTEFLDRIGRGFFRVLDVGGELLSFIGITLATTFRVLINPARWRVPSIVHHMEEAGMNAIPIVSLMSFLIGAVVAFMGAKILEQFNATFFVVELVGFAVLREFGVLLAAILVAGRSGSAFTAQIGSMKIREEIDALRVMGLDPVEVLIVPRMVALVVMLPLLTFIAAMFGMVGGILVAWGTMDISPAYFMARTQEMIVLNNFWVGIIKAPFFAFVIAVIGCFQGMEVEGSAESLGQRTTMSVVQSLFVVIVLDAFFAMFFLEINF